ncbi:hypothetical protein AAFF_G00352580 [Aldrovandia affinis]|uniref:Uncharacterized protein n=1 Tax=Aldrovandia affinis TaxID=143900 RepID=A0AAD7SIX8_9TELE|nr:hypothetical protein AAFF_G00352580 [Aldrovandia affinis]
MRSVALDKVVTGLQPRWEGGPGSLSEAAEGRIVNVGEVALDVLYKDSVTSAENRGEITSTSAIKRPRTGEQFIHGFASPEV